MNKVRIYELAKKLNIDSKELVIKIRELGISVTGYRSAITSSQAETVEQKLTTKKNQPKKK